MIFRTKTIQVKEIKPGIVELQFRSSSSANTLNVRTLKSIAKSLKIIKHFNNLQGVVITSDKKHFITSANIHEYPYLFSYPTNELRAWIDYVKHIFLELENFPVPTVAALTGYTLAEGCELALTCDFRIGDTTTQIGLPQIKFGLIPGFGGTVLLPRIIGMEHAVPLIINGNIIDAPNAQQIGLLDKVVEPDALLTTALEQLEQAIQNKALWQERRYSKQQVLTCDSSNARLISAEQQRLWKKLNKHYVAQFSAISLIADTWRINREQALVQETNHFITLAKSVKTKTLITNNLNEQFIKSRIASNPQQAPKQIAVIGSGVIGGDISLQVATHNIGVLFKSTQAALLDTGMKRIHSRLNQAVNHKQISASLRNSILGNIVPSTDNKGMESVDIAIESITESRSVKQTVLKNIEDHLVTQTIITTNTSCIPMAELETKLSRRERF